MEIEVGEYVRTREGTIYQVYDLEDYGFIIDRGMDWIVKHSKDIIDLIEEGDYVNGKLIKMNYETGRLSIPKDIKSIVTKEMFKSVEFEV